MRKNYFLAAMLALFVTVGSFAQFEDDMESYTTGTQINEGWWTSWDGSTGLAIFSSDAYAQSGSKSGFVDGSGIDPVLDLGNKIFGTWYFTMYMYVPSGKEGYFNVQGTVPIGGGEWVFGNIHLNEGTTNPGVGEIDNSPLGQIFFDFPHDAWFEVTLNVDISLGISAATCQMIVDGVEIIPAGTPFTDGGGTIPTSFGGLNLYSISGNNEYYVDDLVLTDNLVGVNDFASYGFSAYPNPVKNVLNLKANEAINSVAIYNILGQEVYSAKLGAMTSQIDMSQMASGAYFVKVNINGTEGTVKVIK